MTSIKQKLNPVSGQFDFVPDDTGTGTKVLFDDGIFRSINTDLLINITYAELVILKNTSLLVKGLKYAITDYKSIWYQIESDSVLEAVDYETLILTATSENTFDIRVQSVEYPNDVLEYNIDLNLCSDGITSKTGQIIYRKDNLNNITGYDHRTITFLFWESVYGSGIYNNINFGVGYGSGQLLTFFDDTCRNNYIGFKPYGDYINMPNKIVFAGSALNNNIQSGSNTYFGYSCQYNDIIEIYDCNIGNVFSFNVIETGFNTNQIGDYFRYNSISNGFFNNAIGTDFTNNKVGIDFSYNIIGDLCKMNIFGYMVSNNNIANDFAGNNINGWFTSNILGEDFFENAVGVYFQNNIFGNACYTNNFKQYCYLNRIGNDFQVNSIGESFVGNTIVDAFAGNNIANDFANNNISSRFMSNTIGNVFKRNVIGEDCKQLIFETQITDFVVGDFFTNSTIKSGANIKFLDESANPISGIAFITVNKLTATEFGANAIPLLNNIAITEKVMYYDSSLGFAYIRYYDNGDINFQNITS